MSLLARALGGLGAGAADLANKYIDDEILRNRQAAFAEIQRKNTLDTEKALYAQQNDPARLDAASARRMAETEAAAKLARRLEVEKMTDPALRSAELDRANFARGVRVADERALANEKVIEMGPGGALYRGSGGAPIAENKRPTAAEVSKYSVDQSLKQLPGSGGAGVQSRFDIARWDQYRKVPKDLITIEDPLGIAKPKESNALAQFYRSSMTTLQQRNTVGPDEASDLAAESVRRLKEMATQELQRAQKEDKRSKMTFDDAVALVIKKAQDAAKAPKSDGWDDPGPATGTRPNPFREERVESPVGPTTPPRRVAAEQENANRAKTPAAAPAATTGGPDAALEQAGAALDEARAAAKAAQDRLMRFGNRQRARDPEGFAAARAEAEAAAAQRDKAERAYRDMVNRSGSTKAALGRFPRA